MIAHVRPSARVTGWRVCARGARSSLRFGVQAEGVQCDGRAAATARPYVRGTEPHNALGLQGYLQSTPLCAVALLWPSALVWQGRMAGPIHTRVPCERTAAFCQAFQKFYVERQPGRKLQWDMSKGRAEARPTYSGVRRVPLKASVEKSKCRASKLSATVVAHDLHSAATLLLTRANGGLLLYQSHCGGTS